MTDHRKGPTCKLGFTSMRRLTHAVPILLGLASLSPRAWADSPDAFVHIQCMTAINRLEVGTFMTWNVCTDDKCTRAAPLAKQGIYPLSEFIAQHAKRPAECDLGGGQKAVLSIADHWPGKTSPGMQFDVTVNGKKIVSEQRYDSDDENMELQIQAFPPSGEPNDAGSVSSSLCLFEGQTPLALADSTSCTRAQFDFGKNAKQEPPEKAEYEQTTAK